MGGLKVAQIVKERYGKDYYVKIGAMGGKVSRNGGFAANPEFARRMGNLTGR